VATTNAIAAVGLAIRGVLVNAASGVFPDARFELFQATDFHKAQDGIGISIFLYRVGANTTRRNLPPHVGLDGRRFRPALPLDLFFLLMPWAASVDTQHRLLGWAMRVLEDTPILPSALLNALDSGTDTFRADEAVELVFDPLSFQDLTALWEVMEPKIQPVATYVARRIDVASSIELADGALVQTRAFDYTPGPQP
jgi:hypothetical protein